MTELETVIVDKLFAANLLKFYIRYVDDTLALIKESDINIVLKKLNSFHPSLKFTVDKFDDDIVHYLDIKIVDNETHIYFKDTHTGQFMHFSSYAPWRIKTAWVKALFQRAVKICSTEELLNQQIKKISLFMLWNIKMSQRDPQVTINPPNAETEIVIILWTRWMTHIPLSFK